MRNGEWLFLGFVLYMSTRMWRRVPIVSVLCIAWKSIVIIADYLPLKVVSNVRGMAI